jgi:hypothetical protein
LRIDAGGGTEDLARLAHERVGHGGYVAGVFEGQGVVGRYVGDRETVDGRSVVGRRVGLRDTVDGGGVAGGEVDLWDVLVGVRAQACGIRVDHERTTREHEPDQEKESGASHALSCAVKAPITGFATTVVTRNVGG